MRIALIGDVHANLPALEAVLAHAAVNGVEVVWNIGDFTGYNAFPDEVVNLLHRSASINLIGNYDQKVLLVERKRKKWSQTKTPLKLLAFEWSYQQLSPANRAYLAQLPEQISTEEQGWQILLVHGSPQSIEEPLTPHTPDARLAELASQLTAQVVIFGHSHMPFVRQAVGICWINTGSVGRPDDGDPRATYALLDLAPGALAVSHHRVEYDVARAADAIRTAGLPEEFARMVERGVSLNALLP